MQSDSSLVDEKLDIIFISYDESNCDRNWFQLKSRFPRAKRVHGKKGIREAHGEAARKSQTQFFFTVDGDNHIVEDFNFVPPVANLDVNSIYVYRCKNPMNDLVYGYGAVKIYNKNFFNRESQFHYLDLATSIASNYEVIHELASETHFFDTPFEAWRASFRECVKLRDQLFKKPNDHQAKDRLEKWCESANDIENSSWVLLGARQGNEFAEYFPNEIHRINNFPWLKGRFDELGKN